MHCYNCLEDKSCNSKNQRRVCGKLEDFKVIAQALSQINVTEESCKAQALISVMRI